ncbi:MAG: M50 family metallopeptidase [Spirochaetes bacterium]|nr:M50 family metallopeptidase [Spirochaetota bacterium]
MKKYGVFKVIILVLGAVLAAGITWRLVKTGFYFQDLLSQHGLYFIAGALLFAAISQFLPLPSAVYVFGHELTHAFAIVLCGGRVTSFNVRSNGGMVTTNMSNSFIALAPYFLPVYMVIVIAAYNIIDIFIPLGTYMPLYYVLLGFTYGFHLGCTAVFARSYQPDLKDEGLVFSFAMIYLANIIVLTAVMKLLLQNFDIIGFYFTAGRDIMAAGKAFFAWFSAR